MEKICIVKLRSRLTAAGKAQEPVGPIKRWLPSTLPVEMSKSTLGCGVRDVQTSNIDTKAMDGATGKTISLILTGEQTKALQSNSEDIPLLDGTFTGALKVVRHQDQPIVIQFHLASPAIPHFLKTDEVIKMLRISKSCLDKLIKRQELRCYKIGRLRRFMLEDILSYLQNQLMPPAALEQDTGRVKNLEAISQLFIKEV